MWLTSLPSQPGRWKPTPPHPCLKEPAKHPPPCTPALQGCFVRLVLNVGFTKKRLKGYMQAGLRGPEHDINAIFFLASSSLGCLLHIKENEEERTFESLMEPQKRDHATISKINACAPPRAQNIKQESGAFFSGEAERKSLRSGTIFLNLGAIGILDQITLCGKDCLRARPAPPPAPWNCNNQKCLSVLPDISGDPNAPDKTSDVQLNVNFR